MRIHTRALIAVALAAAVLTGAGCAPPPGGKKIIRLCHSHKADPVGDELHFAATVFRDYVNARSDTLEVRIYAGNALGEERTVCEALQIGAGPTCIISGSAILNNFCPVTSVVDLPYLWDSYEHAHRALDGRVGRTLARELERRGFKVLAWMDSWGYRNLVTTRRLVRGPTDIAGLKIRTIQTPVYVAGVRMLGANATPMAGGEVYSSLQTGILDGFEHTAAMVASGRFYEVTGHVALTRHFFGPLVFAYSKKQWDKLTDEERRVVSEAARLARDRQRKLASTRDAEALRKLMQNNMTANEVDTRAFRRNAVRLQDRIAARVGAQDLLRMIRAKR